MISGVQPIPFVDADGGRSSVCFISPDPTFHNSLGLALLALLVCAWLFRIRPQETPRGCISSLLTLVYQAHDPTALRNTYLVLSGNLQYEGPNEQLESPETPRDFDTRFFVPTSRIRPLRRRHSGKDVRPALARYRRQARSRS